MAATYCTQCGFECNSNDKFCAKCGRIQCPKEKETKAKDFQSFLEKKGRERVEFFSRKKGKMKKMMNNNRVMIKK